MKEFILIRANHIIKEEQLPKDLIDFFFFFFSK